MSRATGRRRQKNPPKSPPKTTCYGFATLLNGLLKTGKSRLKTPKRFCHNFLCGVQGSGGAGSHHALPHESGLDAGEQWRGAFFRANVSLVRFVPQIAPLWLATLASVGFMFIFLLVGVAGPQAVGYELDYAYGCNNDTHHGTSPCEDGVRLTSGATFRTNVDRIDPLYQYVALQVYPFMLPGFGPNSTVLTFNVSLYGALGPSGRELMHLWSRQVSNRVDCVDSDAPCSPFYLVDEPELFYTRYHLEVFIPGGSDAVFLGDFLFQWEANNPAFMREQVGVRLTMFFIALIVAVWYAVRLAQARRRNWTMEQTWGLVLVVALLLYNNPLFPLQVYSSVPFWPVLFSLFDGLFLALFMLYCLLYLDMIRSDDKQAVRWNSLLPWLKVGAVSVYLLLSVSLFMWEQVLFINDPIVRPSTLAGPSALFYVVALCYAGLVCWLVVLLIFAAPLFFSNSDAAAAADARSAPPAASPSPPPLTADLEGEQSRDWNEVTESGASSSSRPVAAAEEVLPNGVASGRWRLMHSCVPMIVVTGFTLINMLGGSLGPFGSSAPSFMFFHTLYNATILLWLCGYWPVGRAASAGGSLVRSDERQPLVANPFAASERQADASEEREEPIFN